VSGDSPAELLIRARWIVPIRRPPIERGWLWFRSGRIVALGSAQDGPSTSGRSVIDLADAVLIPGLVNAHTHLEFSDVRLPLDASGGLADWIGRVIDLRGTRGSGDDAERRRSAAVQAGIVESAAHGVTAIGEISTGIPPDGYPAAGPRLRVFREALGLAPERAAAAARDAECDLAALRAAGTAAGISPHAPYSVAASLGRRLIELARRSRLPLAMHIAESETEAALLGTGTGPFRELFERLGVWPSPSDPTLLRSADWITLLSRGPRGVIVHGTHLGGDADALGRIARHRDRLCMAVCPRTTLAISRTLPPVRLFRNAGIRVAIGTDSRASAPDLSVLSECRALVDGGVASPEETLRMATTEAAWALGFERLSGILAPGRPADFVILQPSGRFRDPWDAILDPTSRVVATLRGGRVIAGRLAGSAPA